MTSNKKVLVVDDSPTIRAILSRNLTNSGLEVTEFSTGDAAVSTVQKMPSIELPICAIVDKDMPGMSGVDCAIILQKRGIRCVAYTATPSPRSDEIYSSAEISVFKKTEMPRMISQVRKLSA